MKICIILGTRPEIIKFCSIMRYCERNKCDYFIVHSNQHYSENMDKIFFDELELPQPKYNLNVGSGSQGQQLAKALVSIEKVLQEEKPGVVLVLGDTNTVLAGALAAYPQLIRIGHVEAGLRSYDRRMPEEVNRVLTDHMADFLFAPTKNQEKILLDESIKKEKIFVVGNTIVDAIFENIELAERKVDILNHLGLKKGGYFLATAHRAENVDDKETLTNLLESLEAVADKYGLPLVYPRHPRTKKMMELFNLKLSDKIIVTEPLGYLEFLHLMTHAKLVLTDSGGLQEETCILKVPCVTLRDNTERPETVEVGANIIAGVKKNDVLKAVEHMLAKDRDWKNPFGDGKTGETIVNLFKDK